MIFFANNSQKKVPAFDLKQSSSFFSKNLVDDPKFFWQSHRGAQGFLLETERRPPEEAIYVGGVHGGEVCAGGRIGSQA